MMKNLLIIVILFSLGVPGWAQQSPLYSQYTFNNFGYNPAFAGTSDCIDFKAGSRLQWLGMTGAPVTSFGSMHAVLSKKKYYSNKGRHGVGFYVEQEKAHVTTRSYVKLAYAYHKRVSQQMTLGVGVFAGIQRYTVDTKFGKGHFDPVLANFGGTSLEYPDIMPGMVLYNNKVYYSLSVNQFYFKKVGLGGDDNKMVNQYYFGWGHKSKFNSWIISKSILLRVNAVGPPSLDMNLSWMYQGNFTVGLGYRVGEAITARVKFRLGDKITIAYGFDFPLNKLYRSNTHELMLGISRCADPSVIDTRGMDPHSCTGF